MFPYIPVTDNDKKEILEEIGLKDIEELFSDIPERVRLNRALDLPVGMSEIELKKYFYNLSKKNGTDYICFRGAGAYKHFIPSVVNHIISRSEFYTAYTPYQPEISQGMLQAIFEYQTMICELTGMDVSNASVYDGATAAAEAAFMAAGITGRNKILISLTVNPEIIEVVKTYCRVSGIEVIEVNYKDGLTDISDLKSKLNQETAGLIVQSPDFFGCIEPCSQMFEMVHAVGAMTILSADPISLGILKSPFELGADIAVGDGQPLGNSLSFGGPYVGFMAVKDKFVRRLPGRIVGETVDKEGNRGYVLTLQAREQHIRREKATSNICSNQALNALSAAVYLSLVGKTGLKDIANLCIQKSYYTANKISDIFGFSLPFSKPFFREFVVKSSMPADELNQILLDNRIIGGYILENHYPELKGHILLCVTEVNTKKDIDNLIEILIKNTTKGRQK